MNNTDISKHSIKNKKRLKAKCVRLTNHLTSNTSLSNSFILSLFIFLSSISLFSQSSEADYCQLINSHLKGEREVSVYAGRVDIVTETHSYEVEWARKWKNSIGQALWYGLQTNKKPGIVIIIKEPSDYRYFQQLNSALLYAELDDKIQVLAWPNDFE